MRISDWSSDVCSSDLVDLEQIDIRRVHAGLLQRLERGWRDAGQHDRRLGADHRRRTDPRTRLDAELLADLLVADQYRGGAVDDAGRIASRSEEHTSELQSLMRISYAVFCLKKKTNTL